jgi:hypothetical protein
MRSNEQGEKNLSNLRHRTTATIGTEPRNAGAIFGHEKKDGRGRKRTNARDKKGFSSRREVQEI